MGSSVPLSRDFDGKGIFSRKQNENPEFHNWNSIFINYCSGTGNFYFCNLNLKVIRDIEKSQ
jgi:hypothetical protein